MKCRKIRIIGAFLMSSIILGSTSAFAANNSFMQPGGQQGRFNTQSNPRQQSNFNNGFTSKQEDYVKSSSDQNMAINAYDKQDNYNRTNNSNALSIILNNLVSDGTITSDVQASIEAALAQQNTSINAIVATTSSQVIFNGDTLYLPLDFYNKHNNLFMDSIQNIVPTTSAQVSFDSRFIPNIIPTTSAQVSLDSGFIPNIIPTTSAQVSLDNGFYQNMPLNASGKQNYFFINANENTLSSILSDLVTEGTLTSTEQSAIETAISNADTDLKTALDNLVTEGIITSVQETAIETAIINKKNIL